ncbi:MAG: polymer-forming cytoskeletal protein [Chloroflexi bacterium]|nr:polymer-forming cytoskeletal protein [Chloroflexota bacterium]
MDSLDARQQESVPDKTDPGFAERVLAQLDAADRQRSRREARRLGLAALLLGLAGGIVLLAALPFRGAGVGTTTVALWATEALVVLGTVGYQEDGLLEHLHLDALPIGVALLVLLCCLLAIWRLSRFARVPGRRMRRRTFLLLFGLCIVALALALLTPLRGWQTGALRAGDTVLSTGSTDTVLVLGGNVRVAPGASGSVAVIFGNILIEGSVRGDVTALLGNVELAPSAVVAGNTIAVGGAVKAQPGSVVRGDVIGSAPLLTQPPRSFYARIRLALAAWTGLLLLGVILSAIFPWPLLLVGATARRLTWQSLLTALGGGIGLLLVIVPLTLSVAGLPIALALLLVTLLSWAFGLVAIGVAVGRRILRPLGFSRSTLLAAVCGLGLMGVLAAVPLIGPVLIIGSGLWGAGAAVISALDVDAAESLLVPVPRSRPGS